MSIQYLPNFVVQKVIPNSQKLTESELSMNTMFLFMNFVPLEMRRKTKTDIEGQVRNVLTPGLGMIYQTLANLNLVDCVNFGRF